MKNKTSLDTRYTEIKDRLNQQFESVNGLDTKAGVVIGFVGVILGILFDKSYRDYYSVISNVLLFLSMVFAFLAYIVKEYRRDPDPEKLEDNYSSATDADLKEQLIQNFIASFKENKCEIKKKKDYINISLLFLLMGILILILKNGCAYVG